MLMKKDKFYRNQPFEFDLQMKKKSSDKRIVTNTYRKY